MCGGNCTNTQSKFFQVLIHHLLWFLLWIMIYIIIDLKIKRRSMLNKTNRIGFLAESVLADAKSFFIYICMYIYICPNARRKGRTTMLCLNTKGGCWSLFAVFFFFGVQNNHEDKKLSSGVQSKTVHLENTKNETYNLGWKIDEVTCAKIHFHIKTFLFQLVYN